MTFRGADPAPSSGAAETAQDVDAVVIGAGHNGLVTAAYLARAGVRTMLVEARASVGGTAASEQFAGATVNICNCDHLTFRTTPVMGELDLAAHGLEYLDIEPAQHNRSWADIDAGWSLHHDVDATIESLAQVRPGEVDGYRRYVKAAMPAVRMILEAAAQPPTIRSLSAVAMRRRLSGVTTIMRWSRRSAADVMRSYFSDDAVSGPAALTGPMVWGISPETPGTGLGALTHAMRHVAQVGRPIGGSGRVTDALLAVFAAAGGQLRTSSAVDTILCHGERVCGVALSDGTEIAAPIVVSACNPHDTFLRWLKRPPARTATDLVRRWSTIAHHDGYESKIDAVLSSPPKLRGGDRDGLGSTTAIAPTLADIDHGATLMGDGRVLDRPGFLVNVPTLLDPSMAPPGRHVLSLEALFTPFALRGGWADSTEPRRWLELFAELCEPGFLDSIVDWRAMTPDVYERDFHLPAGHATSFAGGPLAALRNHDPELTKYETAVDGLYLTGAATFPGAGVWGASGRNCAAVILERHA